ncbi:hypothetical protein NDU88_004610 [Pleurodeles waltl]|uniref:Uncharacterized protein n=1 Tax=Pleurodeles waltl TaxID=8319 RepID=A0AAV7UFZ2_PLEWA|nr:hypothetical protein NDU88_004610 [Pleurodeles waltl]
MVNPGAGEAVLTPLLREQAIIAAAPAGGLGWPGGALGVGSPVSLSLDPRVRAEAADTPGRQQPLAMRTVHQLKGKEKKEKNGGKKKRGKKK